MPVYSTVDVSNTPGWLSSIWMGALKMKSTPWKINMEPENHGLVQMIFVFNWVIFRFRVNLPGCTAIYALKPAKSISPNWVIFSKVNQWKSHYIFHKKNMAIQGSHQGLSRCSPGQHIKKNKQFLATQPCPCFPSMAHLAFHKFEGPSAWPSSLKIPSVDKQEGADSLCKHIYIYGMYLMIKVVMPISTRFVWATSGYI